MTKTLLPQTIVHFLLIPTSQVTWLWQPRYLIITVCFCLHTVWRKTIRSFIVHCGRRCDMCPCLSQSTSAASRHCSLSTEPCAQTAPGRAHPLLLGGSSHPPQSTQSGHQQRQGILLNQPSHHGKWPTGSFHIFPLPFSMNSLSVITLNLGTSSTHLTKPARPTNL